MLKKEINDNRIKKEKKSTFDIEVIEDEKEDLENFLKDKKVKILRQA